LIIYDFSEQMLKGPRWRLVWICFLCRIFCRALTPPSIKLMTLVRRFYLCNSENLLCFHALDFLFRASFFRQQLWQVRLFWCRWFTTATSIIQR
jgi:hypothetical protein